MVHTRYGIGQLRAAEVRRGCIFAEPLDSVDGVLKNGGVIGSGAKFVSPTEGFRFSGAAGARISYGDVLRNPMKAITMMAWFKCDNSVATRMTIFGQNTNATYSEAIDIQNGQLRYTIYVAGLARSYPIAGTWNDGNWHHAVFTWYSPLQIRAYVDGVLIGATGGTYSPTTAPTAIADNLTIGASYCTAGEAFNFKGSIRNCMVFNTALDADEIAAYYNGSMFRYDDYCVCDLPFDIAHHDTVNKRSLDVSGYNNHATWGDGSTTTTFPTKLANSRGYSFDGGDYMRTPIVPTEKMSVYIQGVFPTTGSTTYLWGSLDGGTIRFYLRYPTPTEVLTIGMGTSSVSTTKKIDDGMIRGILLNHESSRHNLYSDGLLVNSTTAVTNTENGFPVFIGALNNNGGAPLGFLVAGSKLFSFKIYSGLYLNQIQYLDLDIRAKDNCFRCP